MTESIVMIERVAAALGPLCQEVVFVGAPSFAFSSQTLADLDDTLRYVY